jgi:hypothetical protein
VPHGRVAVGEHALRAKYRDAGLDESDWSEGAAFIYVGYVATPELTIPDFAYSGSVASVDNPDEETGDYRIQYSDNEDFTASIVCDTGWFGSGVNSVVSWELPQTMDPVYDPTPCDDLPIGTYAVRAKFRHTNTLEESLWMEPQVFDYAEIAPPPDELDIDVGAQATPAGIFGGWWTTLDGNGVNVRGTRATILLKYALIGNPNANFNCISTHRVDMEQWTSDLSKFGLIQAGVTNSRCGDCGANGGPYSFVEYKAVNASTTYTCEIYSAHSVDTAKKYAVLKYHDQGTCTGCYIARINGSQVGQIHALGTVHDGFDKADFAGATSEYSATYSTAQGQSSRVRWGKKLSNETPWQRTSQAYCCGQTWTTISDPDECSNTDDHYVFAEPYNHNNGWFVKRWVTNGAPNDDSC